MFKVRCFIPHALERLLAFTFQFLFFFLGQGITQFDIDWLSNCGSKGRKGPCNLTLDAFLCIFRLTGPTPKNMSRRR